MESQICYSCFSTKSSAAGACPRCGYDAAADVGKYPHALPLGSILNGRYILGRVLGQGGFGITYVAQDDQTGGLVAIKEFFPETVAARVQHHTVCAHSVQQQENFTYGMQCFLNEAQTLAQFIGMENIVRVHSYFEENGTAYFVMDHVDGISFQTYLRQKGGKISWEEARSILLPVMDALSIVHRKGIIHRDISPDNIYISRDGTVKLLDFGAARYSLGNRSRSLDVVLKAGYAPMEQYARRGRQGPYTDVYSMAATFYFAITGHLPPDSVERADEDNLVLPSSYGIKIPPQLEDTMETALSVRASDRYQTMEEFRSALLRVSDGTPPPALDPVVPTVEIPVPPVQPEAPLPPPVQTIPQQVPLQVPLQPVQPATPQPSPQPPKKKEKQTLSVILSVCLGIVLVFATILIQFPKTEEGQAGEPLEPVAETSPAQTEMPTNGWYKQGGRSYYYEDGIKCIGMIQIGKYYYYFDNNGALMTNTTAENDSGLKFRVNEKGQIIKICYPQIQGNWGTVSYTYGNGGKSNAMEFTPPVERVTSTVVYVQASGLHGSTVDGNWRLYFRINGQWVDQGEFSFSGSSTTVYVPLDHSTTIEAVTAHPLIQGNASYSAYFELQDVWCEF